MADDEAVDNANTAPPGAAPPPLNRKARYVCLKQAANGQWYYRTEGANREPVYTSETFRRKHSTEFEYVLEYDNDDGVKVRETL